MGSEDFEGKMWDLIVSLPDHYTPGIYAEGYIVFAFPFVLLSIRMFVGDYVMFMEFTTKFCKFLKRDISHEPLIRKHSYLDHRYPGGSAFIP